MSKPSSQARHVALRLAGLGLVCGGMNDYKGRTIRIHPSTLASMGRDGLLEKSDILDPNTGASNCPALDTLRTLNREFQDILPED